MPLTGLSDSRSPVQRGGVISCANLLAPLADKQGGSLCQRVPFRARFAIEESRDRSKDAERVQRRELEESWNQIEATKRVVSWEQLKILRNS